MSEGVISVNIVNFLTVGLMALIFIAIAKAIQTKAGIKIPLVG